MLAALVALSGPSASSAYVGAFSGGKTLYVDPAGSDVNSCTQAKPCLSFGRGYAVSLPGDTVHVAPGTYGPQNIGRGSHSQAVGDAPVTFEAKPGTVTTGTILLGIKNGSPKGDTPNHLHFDGIGVNGCVTTTFSGGSPGGSTSDALDFAFVNGHVWNMSGACHLLNLNGLDGIVVMHTELGPMCCGADAVEFGIPRIGALSDANATFVDVQVHDLYDTCKNLPASIKNTYGCGGYGYGDCPGANCPAGADHVDGFQGFGLLGANLFERVRVWAINPRSTTSTGAAQSFFMQSANGGRFSNFTIENSTFGCGCGTNDVSFSGPGVGVYSGYLRARYNSIQRSFPIYARLLAPGTSVELTGNLIGGFTHENPSTACTFVAADGSTIAPMYSHNLYGAGPAGGCGPGDRRGPALFTDGNYYNPNFTPQAGSLAINAGDPARHPVDDVNGNPRPQNFAPDIGAIQGNHVDVTAPTLTNVPADRVLEALGATGATAPYTSPTATDNADPSPTVSCSPASGATFPLGTTTVTCTATDAGGNRSAAMFKITVRDTIAPTLGLPSNRRVEATGAGGAIVSFTPTPSVVVNLAPTVSCSPSSKTFPIATTIGMCIATDATATDAVDAHPTLTCKPGSGSVFALGATSVRCTATDAAGNTSTGSFTVIVGDTTAPTAPRNPSPSNATRTSDDLSWAASTDAVGVTGYDLWLDGVPAGSTAGSRFTFGGLACGTAHTLAVAAHDAAGNESQQSSATVSTLLCAAPTPTPTTTTTTATTPTSTPTPTQTTTTTTTTTPVRTPIPKKLGLLNSVANSATATQTLALSAVQAGDTAIAVVFGNASRPLSVHDNLGNTYTMDAASGAADALSSTSIYRYQYSAAQTSLRLSVSWTNPIFHQQVAVYAIPNLVAAPLDGHVASGAKTATPSISASSTTKRNEVAIAAFRVMELNWVGSGWPAREWNVLTNVFPPTGNGHVLIAYRLLPRPGPVSLGFSLGATTADWSGALTTYAGT